MSSEGVARGMARLVAAGNPGPSLDEIVPFIEGRGAEIIVQGMDLESVEGINRRFGPLPDIAHHIEQGAMREQIDRAG